MRKINVYLILLLLLLSFLLVSFLSACQTPHSTVNSDLVFLNRQKNQGIIKLPGKIVNRIRFTVGDIPITETDIREMSVRMKKLGKRRGPMKKDPRDELIVRAIVRTVAERESIIITSRRVRNEIKRQMESSRIADEYKFRKLVEKQTGMPFEDYEREIPYNLMRRHIIELRVSKIRPTEDEVRRYYLKHKKQMGVEVSYREIFIRYKGISEERSSYKAAKAIYSKIAGNRRLFASLALSSSRNVSKLRYRGGYRAYVPLHKIVQEDRLLAGMLYNMHVGQLSPPQRDPRTGRYIILLLLGKRSTPYNRIRQMIFRRLMVEKVEESFDRWIETMKKKIAIVKVS